MIASLLYVGAWSRKPNWSLGSLKVASQVYDGLQVLSNAYILWHCLESWMVEPLTLGHFFRLGDLPTPSEKTIFYLSKYLDWYDTLHIIATGSWKRLSVLHHATTNVIFGGCCHLGYGGGAFIFTPTVNSFIHLVMYTHYLVTSFGFRNPLKAWITRLQLVLGMIHGLATSALYWDLYNVIGYLETLYALSLYWLFYREEYKAPKDLDR